MIRGGRLRKVCAGLGVALLAWVGLSLCAATVPAVWGWQPRVVVSGSMEPAISTGDVVLIGNVEPDQLRAGMVILGDLPGDPGKTYLHRVVSVEGAQVVTRGDANRANDSSTLSPAEVRGAARLVVPLVGWPLLWAQEPSFGRSFAAGVTMITLLAAYVVAQRTWGTVPGPRRGRRARGRVGRPVPAPPSTT